MNSASGQVEFLTQFFFKKIDHWISHNSWKKKPRNVSQLFYDLFILLLYYQEERLIFTTVLITFLSYWIMAVLTALRTYISMYYSQQPTLPYHSTSRCMFLLFSVYCRDYSLRKSAKCHISYPLSKWQKRKVTDLECFALNTKYFRDTGRKATFNPGIG